MIKEAKIGLGGYGVIYSAHSPSADPNNENRQKQERLAVKRNLKDSKVSFIDSIRELDMLVKLSGHPNIVLLKYVTDKNPFGSTIMSPVITRGLTDDGMFFVFEKATCDLIHIIRNYPADNTRNKLVFLHSLLGLEYMHKMSIIHRDIKPGNILWFTAENTAKICDFGLSSPFTINSEQPSNAVTHWYRAPEIVTGEQYDQKIDVYALAYSMMEVYTKKPVLYGTNDNIKDILEAIMRTTIDDQSEIDKLVAKTGVRCTYRMILHGINDPVLLDLLRQMSRLDPKNRFTATQALDHPFFEEYRSEIAKGRKIPINHMSQYVLTINPCIERRWMLNTVYTIFNNRNLYHWYTHQILFQAIDIFDRLLNYLPETETSESKYNGKYLSKIDTHIYTLVCIYISIKYFRVLQIPVPYSHVAATEYRDTRGMIKAEEFEKYIIGNVLRYKIYRPTIYDCAAHKLSDTEVKNLLVTIADTKRCQSKTPQQILKLR